MEDEVVKENVVPIRDNDDEEEEEEEDAGPDDDGQRKKDAIDLLRILRDEYARGVVKAFDEAIKLETEV